MSASTATPNYQVTAENAAGLLFKNKRDRKILNVDPKVLCINPDYIIGQEWLLIQIKLFCARNAAGY